MAKVLVAYYILAFFIMWYSSFLAQKEITNTYVYNYLLLPISLFFYFIYFYKITTSLFKRRVILILLILNITFDILQRLFTKQPLFFNSTGFALLSITIVIYCFLFFNDKLKNISENNIYELKEFWLVSSYFITYSGSFVVFLTYYHLTNKIYLTNKDDNIYLMTLLWGIPNILLFFSSILTFIGYLWIQFRKSL